jgi:hypothetical protein
MEFDLKDVLEAVGPTASLVFAAWIYLSFLQQRYAGAYDRYRSLIDEYRTADLQDHRKTNVRDQILLYKQRCEQMRLATNLGVFAAIILILTLVTGALSAIFPSAGFLKYIGAAGALIGLLMVIAAAIPVILENNLIQRAIESEISDLPEISEAAGQPADYRTQ